MITAEQKEQENRHHQGYSKLCKYLNYIKTLLHKKNQNKKRKGKKVNWLFKETKVKL